MPTTLAPSPDALVGGAASQHLMAGAVASGSSGSLRPHHKLGFENAGTLKRVGAKFGRWLDLTYLTRRLNDAATPD